VKEVVVTGRACIWLAAGFAATWTVSPLASVQHRLDWPGAVPLTQVGDSDGTNHELLVASAYQQPSQAPAEPGAQAPGGPEQAPVFRGAVEVVNLSVTVTDEQGRVVNGLTQNDFIVLDAGKQQEIVNFRTVGRNDATPVPLGLGLVLDFSTSMCDLKDFDTGCTASEKLQSLKAALENVFTRYLNKEDELYFVQFSARANVVTKFTNDLTVIRDAIRSQRTTMGTAIYDAIGVALPESARGKHKKQVMLVITDGEDRDSKVNRAQLAQAARNSGVIIYVLVVADEEGVRSNARDATSATALRQAAEELRQVTNATGGKTLFVRGFSELEKAMNEVASDFTTQYEISFVRGAEKDGKYHPIQVGVRRKGVVIRHAPGYVAD
jgi:VWFA-related protein